MVYIPCDRKYVHISSSVYRALEKVQEGAGSEYLVKPEMVKKHITLKEQHESLIIPEEGLKETTDNPTIWFVHPEPAENLGREIAVSLKNIKDNSEGWHELPFAPGYKFKGIKFVFRNNLGGNFFRSPGIYLEYEEYKRIE
jgi:hypothetical protein